jgi:carboxyl-terminal processing protease
MFALVLFIGVLFFGLGYVASNKNVFGDLKGDALAITDDSSINFETFTKVWKLMNQKFVSTTDKKVITDEDKMWGAIEGMVSSFDDPYTVFLPPTENENFEMEIGGSFSGVGMEVDVIEGLPTVVTPLKNTPAEKAGMKSGDIIVKIDDKDTTGMSVQEAVSMIRGKIGTSVKLTILREGEKDYIEKNIVRENIKLPTSDYELRKDGIGIISLYNFNANATSEFRSALRKFISSGSKKLIIDLRGNPGGYLDSAVDISSWFLPAGKAIVSEDFGGAKEAKTFRSKGDQVISDDVKIVILVNKGSASASEIVAGALKDYKRATLIGTQTFGKGSVQELVPITKETSLKVTVARWLTPLGNSFSGEGIKPDIVVDTAPEGKELKDYQLEKAVEFLNTK